MFFPTFIASYSTKNEETQNNNNIGITLYNKSLGISSLINKSKLTNIERNLLGLTHRIESILIGLLLSDGWFQKRGHWNPRFGLKQSIINFPLLWYVFSIISHYCRNLPHVSSNVEVNYLTV